MTPEAQRIAIAEACGWKEQPIGKLWKYRDDERYAMCASHAPTCNQLPDYLTDLNAMHEAEETLLNEQRRTYARTLVTVHPLQYDPTNPGPFCQDGGAMNLFLIASMTAAQRAEAFLKTLGKWDDSK